MIELLRFKDIREKTMPRWSSKKGEGAGIKFILAHADYAFDDCLIWPLSLNTGGYGNLGYRGKIYRAHRYMCELVNGAPPSPEHEAAHSCGRGHEGCVNPRHLSWKTHQENLIDRRAHGTVPDRSRRVVLTAEQVAEIRSLEGKKSIAELMAMFKTSHSNLLDILRRHSWKDGTPGKCGFSIKLYRHKPKTSQPKAE